MKGLDEVQALASSGRTSIPINKEISKALYRIAGYRVCGERAVRVDILERLADLIRPALAWRENAPGVKPAGALDGRGFTVTVGMTSLVGSSGEDFASILRSLGYRMDRKPKPAEAPAPEPTSADVSSETAALSEPAAADVPSETAAPAGSMAPVETSAEPAEVAVAQTPELEVGSRRSFPGRDRGGDGDRARPVRPAGAGGGARRSRRPTCACARRNPLRTRAGRHRSRQTGDGRSRGAGPAAAPQSAEEQFIEVWRPGRFENRDRHRRRPQRAERQPAPAQERRASGGGGRGSAGRRDRRKCRRESPAPQRERHQRRRHSHRGERPERRDGERPHHGKGKPRFEGKRSRSERTDHGERRERAERQPDPNSPFAKLAALKAQLEADSKERR